MLRRLDRIRFRGTRREEFVDLTDSPNTSDNEGTEDVPIKAQCSTRETEELRDGDVEVDLHTEAQAGPGFYTALHDDRTDLTEVKGLLEIALLEKHFLQEELRKLKEETNIDILKQDLERERLKRIELEQKVNEALKNKGPEDSPSHSQKVPPPITPASGITEKRRESLYDRFMKWIYDRFGVYIEDFRFQPEEETVEAEEPLSAKRLTENMRRLKRGFRPLSNFKRNVTALSSWYSVYTSAIAFLIYMYAAWYGWTIPMFLFLAIVRLSLNYLIARGWRIQWTIVPEISEPVEPPKEDLTVSEKFQLVLDVAQRAQNIFGKMANILEKIKNLFMWVRPELTQKLYVGLWVAFLASCFLPFKLLGFIIGMYTGIKFFIIDFFLKRSLKLRQRFDTPYVIWTNLPTDLQLKERTSSTISRRVASASGRSHNGAAAPMGLHRDEETGRTYSTKRGPFHEVFHLPETEHPLTACETGWRCCLINRDKKTPTDYIRNGVLFITENYLCFEVSTSRSGPSKRNKVIRLNEITEVLKVDGYKVLSVLPGSGMGISIATPTTQKPLVFGGMTQRDEAFDAILFQRAKVTVSTDLEEEAN
ncbi:GRAM domain-containing protein 4-like [Periophthalmus magnuspinnatus]|uniref:GRAM domain-containing protein 4-like n=1 Tax=Periophthalmus magnuspinnatus TaxID=409849 RepID=UPI00145B0FBA|nr:GRAM domain-containing protein 4-like [Periophthalmus magnuspinnatus]